MHEMSLCESIVEIAEGEARRQGLSTIKLVRIEVGALSHAEPAALAFCFEAVTRGTMAEGATLEILRPRGKAWCVDCRGEVEIAARFDPCPNCGGAGLYVTGGEELRVKDLEAA
ncbi:MAG: hydrogenase maturation nickel metallochaperone HypA [Hyphomonadaceae bacterium]